MKRTNKKHYNDMLEVLPPEAISHGRDIDGNEYSAFLVGEPSTHIDGVPVYASFFYNGTDYYVGDNMTKVQLYELMRDIPRLQELMRDAEDIDGINGDILAAYDEHGEDITEAYAYCFGWDYTTAEKISDAYMGEYESDELFAQEQAESMGVIDESPAWPYTCIDWERAARDLMYDYCEHNGYYFSNY